MKLLHCDPVTLNGFYRNKSKVTLYIIQVTLDLFYTIIKCI